MVAMALIFFWILREGENHSPSPPNKNINVGITHIHTCLGFAGLISSVRTSPGTSLPLYLRLGRTKSLRYLKSVFIYLLSSCSRPWKNFWGHSIKFCIHWVCDTTKCTNKKAITMQWQATCSYLFGSSKMLQYYQLYHKFILTILLGTCMSFWEWVGCCLHYQPNSTYA